MPISISKLSNFKLFVVLILTFELIIWDEKISNTKIVTKKKIISEQNGDRNIVQKLKFEYLKFNGQN